VRGGLRVSWLLTFTPPRAVLSLAALIAALTGLSVLVIWRLGFGVRRASAPPPARLRSVEFGPDGFARANPAHAPPVGQGIHQDEPET